MRPLESFSTFSAHGTMKCFTGLATGGRNVCSRSVTSCAVAAVGAKPRPDARAPASAAKAIRFIVVTPSVKCWDSSHRYSRSNHVARQQSAPGRYRLGMTAKCRKCDRWASLSCFGPGTALYGPRDHSINTRPASGTAPPAARPGRTPSGHTRRAHGQGRRLAICLRRPAPASRPWSAPGCAGTSARRR